MKITTSEELIDYLLSEFSAFFLFFPAWTEFIKTTIRKITEKRARLLDTPIEQCIDNPVKRQGTATKEEIDNIQDRVFSSIFEQRVLDSLDNDHGESSPGDLPEKESEDDRYALN